MYEDLLKKEKISGVAILVGIPSFNEEKNISFIVKKIDSGLQKHYPAEKALIVNCDSGSTDSTKENFMNTKTKTKKMHIGTPNNEIGKGNALKILLELAVILKPSVVVIDDSDLISLSIDWIKIQAQPVFDGYDFVVPNYRRFKYDGTITNNLGYPLITAIFCEDIRQPIGGEFSFSGKIAEYFLKKCRWTSNTSYFGIDIFMTAHAILGDFKIGQCDLGVKIHSPKDPGKTLSPMFRQVISTLFKIICENKQELTKRKTIKQIPLLGKSDGKPVQTFKIDEDRLKERFGEGFREYKKIMKKCLSPESYSKVRKCMHFDKISIKADAWSKIVYDYIVAFKKYEDISSTVLRSFEPLWFARTYSFVQETKNMPAKEAEELIKKQAEIFFENRGYLIKRL